MKIDDRLEDKAQSHISYLVHRYVAQEATAAELEELYSFIRKAEHDGEIGEALNAAWGTFQTIEVMPAVQADAIYEAILRDAGEADTYRTRVLDLRTWKRIAVAASVLLVVSLGLYRLFMHQPTPAGELVNTVQPVSHEVEAPSTSKAVIVLADGRRISLDSVANGTLATESNMSVIKKADGQIAYAATGNPSPAQNVAMVYNTLINPRGSKVIALTLSDGTQVWLNAGSSIQYPAVFAAGDRKVTVDGEAYFEVAHDLARPFLVGKGNMFVKVLGTHFNVNAYDDEKEIRVTLLEGSVGITLNNNRVILKPGQQAVVTGGHNIETNRHIDLEEVMAWKNGMFKMNRADISTIMRQLSRWYDVDVEYENGIPQGTISGDVPRTLSLSQVLKVYEYSGVQFRIEGKKIMVLQ